MTDTLALVKGDEQVAALQAAAESVAERAESLEVMNESSLATANSLGSDVSSAVKGLEARRKYYVDPLNGDLKKVNNFFHTLSDPLKAAKSILSKKILTWRAAEQKKIDEARREAEAKARAEERLAREKEAEAEAARLAGNNRRAAQLERSAAKKQETAEMAAVGAAAMVGAGPEKSMHAGDGVKNKTSMHWVFEIVDESVIPRRFLKVDEKSIREAVTKMGVREIPGVRIFETERMSFGSR